MEDVVFIRLEEASALNDPNRNQMLLETGGLLVGEKETQRFVSDNIVLNGTPPLQTLYFLVLNGTDSSSSNAGDNIIMENSHATDVARLTTETSVVSNAAEDETPELEGKFEETTSWMPFSRDLEQFGNSS